MLMAAAYCFRRCPGLFKALFLVWMLLAGALLARAGDLLQAAQEANSSTYTLRGTVINSVTGNPIRRVLVQAGAYAQLTDAQGHFEFSGLPAGQFAIGVQKPGFFDQETGNGTPPTMIDVGPKTPDVIIKLIPEGVIFGRLTDEHGEPMEGVFMQVRGWAVVNGRRRLRQMGAQSTDEEGYFRIFGLRPGTYYLQAGELANRRGPLRMSLSSRSGGYSSSYFPGVRQFSAATPLRVGAGQKVQADFSLHRVAAFQVSGQVAFYAGGRVAAVFIIDSSDRSISLPVEVDPGSGTFVAREVPAGSYVIQAQGVEGLQEPSGRQLIGEKGVTVSSNLTGVVVPMSPGVSIPVLVETEFSGSSLLGNQSPVQVQLWSAGEDEQVYVSQGPQPGRENNDPGVFLESVRPGRYYVEVQPQGNWYVESATSGGADLFGETLVVGSGSPVAPIRITLRDDGASLSGTVRLDGKPASASVLLVRQDEPLRVPQMIMSDRQGAFQITNLPPGDYVVLAFDNMAELEYANRDALREYFSQGVRITLGSSDAKTINVDVIRR